MLSPTERDRLKNRLGIDSQERASNDARVRKKLAMWLKEDLDDVYLILDNLPEDQLKRVFKDDQIFRLFTLVETMMKIKDFRAIYGGLNDPDNWKVLNHPGESEPNRSAEDQDVLRGWNLNNHIDNLHAFYGHESPFTNLALLLKMDADEELRARVTPEERKGLERIRRVLPRMV